MQRRAVAGGHVPARRSGGEASACDYDRLASSYDDVRGDPPFMDEWVRRIAAALRLREGARVLDAGCGTGSYATRLAAFARAEMIGLDMSRGMLAKARAKSSQVGLAQGTALRLPFRDGSFDAVAAVFLLHHLGGEASPPRGGPAELGPRIGDWRGFLAEAARVLRADGSLAILTRSHAQLRASVMADFPGVLEIDLGRFPDVPEIEGALRHDVGEVDVHLLAKGPNSLSVEEWLRRARTDFISTLSLLTDEQRRAGLAEFERRMRAKGPVVEDRSTFTLLVARKGPR